MAFSAVASILAILAAFPVASQAHTECSTLSLVQPPTVALDPNVALMVGPTLLFESGEWVTVSWTGIEAWMFPDAFIAAFSPGTPLDDPDTITDVAPVKYQFLTAGKPYPGGDLLEVESAVGGARNSGAVPDTGAVSSLRFRLLNLRDVEGYRFGLFTGGVEAPVLVAKTKEAVTFAQPFEVQHVHLALTSEANSMRVSWVTGHSSQAPAVRFRGIAPGAEEGMSGTQVASWQEVTAEPSRSYGRDDMCGAPATTKGFHDPGLLHSAVLKDLTPGQPYEYQAGDSDVKEWSKSSFFYAAPSYSNQAADAGHVKPSGKTVTRSPATAAAVTATARTRHIKRRASELNEARPARSEPEAEGLGGTWGSDAVKVAIFGDMGTAEVDGTIDSGHSNEPPSLRTVGILKDHLRGINFGVGARTVAGDDGALGGEVDGGAEPQLGLVLHIGDLSYARGYDAQWDEFMDEIQPVASAVPWMVGVGNHERDYPSTSASEARPDLSFYTGTDSEGECGVPTAFRFTMPGPAEDPMGDSPWYGFDFGPIHFTVMSTEHDFSPGSTQHAFIEDDLSSVDRTKTPWLVFAGHRPMYVNSDGPGAGDCEGDAALEPNCGNDQPVAELLRSSLEPLLIDHQVDLAVYGHHHSYQRTCKVANEVCLGFSSQSLAEQSPGYTAPVHVILGTAGMGLSHNMASPRPEWVEYATDREFGLGMIVADSSRLELSFLLDSDSQVGDEVVLLRPSPSSSLSLSSSTSLSSSSSWTNRAPVGLVNLLWFASLLMLV